MRSFLLVPLLGALATSFSTSNLSAADSSHSEAQEAVHMTKEIATAIQAIKDKTGAYPTTVTITVKVNGADVPMAVTVTGLPAGFSFKGAPTDAGKATSPVTNLSADVAGSSAKTLTVESIYASTASKADVVAFSTSGTELAVTYTLNGTNVSTTESTLVAGDKDAGQKSHKAPAVTENLPVASTASTSSTLPDATGNDQSTSTDAGVDILSTLATLAATNNATGSTPAFTSGQTVNPVAAAISGESP